METKKYQNKYRYFEISSNPEEYQKGYEYLKISSQFENIKRNINALEFH